MEHIAPRVMAERAAKELEVTAGVLANQRTRLANSKNQHDYDSVCRQARYPSKTSTFLPLIHLYSK